MGTQLAPNDMSWKMTKWERKGETDEQLDLKKHGAYLVGAENEQTESVFKTSKGSEKFYFLQQ